MVEVTVKPQTYTQVDYCKLHRHRFPFNVYLVCSVLFVMKICHCAAVVNWLQILYKHNIQNK